MLLANDPVGLVRPPRRSGERGSCPGCEAQVISKVGLIVRPHWAHHNASECDTWAGGETDWHLGWKSHALKAGWRVEVSMREGDVLHRADAVSRRGHIVEFQHSGLKVPEIEERSGFYGRHGVMCWVLDGEIRQWRSAWWDWRKGRSEPPAGVSFVVLDELGRQLKARAA